MEGRLFWIVTVKGWGPFSVIYGAPTVWPLAFKVKISITATLLLGLAAPYQAKTQGIDGPQK